MTNVIAWPPFKITGWALDENYPQSRSVGLIEGQPRTSSAQRARRFATAIISGIGTDRSGAGYVRMLNRQWAGNPRLVRVRCFSSLWFLAKGGLDLRAPIEWVADGADLLWTSGGSDVSWQGGDYSLSGTPVLSGGWHGVEVSGLPPSRIVARPSELITVIQGGNSVSGYALTVVRSDQGGNATILTDRASAFPSGAVSVGDAEEIVFEALEVPRSVQGLSGDFLYSWEFREVFEDEYPDGWTDVDPW